MSQTHAPSDAVLERLLALHPKRIDLVLDRIERLPEGFQRAEYLLEHGMIDMIVHRHNLKETLSRVVRLLTKRPAAARAHGNGKGNGFEHSATSAAP